MEEVVAYESPFKSTDDEINYESLVDEYCDRYFDIADRYENLYSRLLECIGFLDKIEIPFCYEYARVQYKDIFDSLKTDVDSLGESIGVFPKTIQEICFSVTEETDDNKKKLCLEHLDYLMFCLNSSMECFHKAVEDNAKFGFELYEKSQLIQPNICR